MFSCLISKILERLVSCHHHFHDSVHGTFFTHGTLVGKAYTIFRIMPATVSISLYCYSFTMFNFPINDPNIDCVDIFIAHVYSVCHFIFLYQLNFLF